MNDEFIHEQELARPSGEAMLRQIRKSCGDTHPRLMADGEAFSRLKEAQKTDELLCRLVEMLDGECAKLLDTKPPEYYVDEGNRLLTTSRRVMKCIMPLALMYNLTSDEKYADRAWREMEAACGFPDWHPSHYLDTAELAYGVALGYDWLYGYLKEEQRKTAEQAIEKFALDTAWECFERNEGWTSSKNNWNEVCCSGIFSACAAVCGVFPKKTERLMGRLICAIENGLSVYAPDGGYTEGPGYWTYGTNYLVVFLSVLTSVCGTDYGLCSAKGLRETMYYPSYMESGVFQFNYHDCGEERIDTSSFLWLAGAFKDPAVGGVRVDDVMSGRKPVSYKDILYYRKKRISPKSGLPKARHFHGIDTVVMRSGWEKADVYAALHGGQNYAGHGDLDIGQFVYDALGERWFCDMGGENYNVEGYWDGEHDGGMRWSYYKKRAEGHNTLVINPDESGGQKYRARGRIIEFDITKDGARAALDMYPAYSDKVYEGAKRIMELKNGVVTISDELYAIESSDIYWFAHMRGVKAELLPDGKGALLRKNGKAVSVKLFSENTDLRFEIMRCELLSGRKPRQGEHCLDDYCKLAIHCENTKLFKASVEIKPIIEEIS